VGERQDANNFGGGKSRVTIREAATLLGVHPNTVRNRVKAGMYDAGKVLTERGETWMIDRNSLTTNTPSSDSQQLVGRVPQEALTILAREIVREAGLTHAADQRPDEKARERFIEAGRENYKALYAYHKDMATLSGATLVALTAITKAMIPNPKPAWLLVVSLGLLFVATIWSGLRLYVHTFRLRQYSWEVVPDDNAEIEQQRQSVRRFFASEKRLLRDLRDFLPKLLYYLGLVAFLVLFLITMGSLPKDWFLI